MTMRTSLRASILGLLVVLLLLTGVLSSFIASTVFRSELESLYRKDYGDRIRNIEWEYGEVDAVSYATSEVWLLQQELIDQLESRFVEDQTNQPFIINGDGEVILHVEGSVVSEEALRTEVAALLEPGQLAERTYRGGAGDLWVLYSYYDSWDWYTGYIVPNSVRLAALHRFQLYGGGAVALIGVIALGIFALYLRGALRPVGEISRSLEAAAQGTLGDSVVQRGALELRSIASSLNDLLSSLRENVGELQRSAEENREVEQTLSATTEQNGRAISSISELLARIETDIRTLHGEVGESEGRLKGIVSTLEGFESGVEEQTQTLESASAGLEQIVTHSRSVSEATERHRSTSEALLASISSSREEMEETRRTVEEIEANTGAISDFLELVKSIAEQTNLLSMNAAIEAAHAGEAGSGFAVVAEEIRKLAGQAGQQSQEMNDVITSIISRIESATLSSRKTSSLLDKANEEMGSMQSSFVEVSEQTDELLRQGERISREIVSLRSASQEVRSGSQEAAEKGREVHNALVSVARLSEEVEQRITEIGGATRESAEAMAELKKATNALTRTAGSLAEAAERWHLNGEG